MTRTYSMVASSRIHSRNLNQSYVSQRYNRFTRVLCNSYDKPRVLNFL